VHRFLMCATLWAGASPLGASICSRYLVGVRFLEWGGMDLAGLTNKEIRKAKATEKASSMGDGGGLYLWVKPTGGKLRRWFYRVEGRTQRRSKSRIPFRALLLVGWSIGRRGKSPRHLDSVRRCMAADIPPCLGERPIAEIEAPEKVVMAIAVQDRGARQALLDIRSSFLYELLIKSRNVSYCPALWLLVGHPPYPYTHLANSTMCLAKDGVWCYFQPPPRAL